jgi:hypothetical protein
MRIATGIMPQPYVTISDTASSIPASASGTVTK